MFKGASSGQHLNALAVPCLFSLPALQRPTAILQCRHRRLAVREAWATPSQLRGEAIVRFILSEDEQTAQVSKEVETYKDIVFLHVRSPVQIPMNKLH